jgi:biotin carboxyl carrier protein
MPGTIMDIRVSVGQAVNEGDTLVILEAMKMENEIHAPSAGTVDAIMTSKGAPVNAGDVLLTLK